MIVIIFNCTTESQTTHFSYVYASKLQSSIVVIVASTLRNNRATPRVLEGPASDRAIVLQLKLD